VAWADEIVVLDAMSADRTRDIAAARGARVFAHKWEGYAEARRLAISKCSFDWVLFIDADERVTADLRSEIQSALARPEHDGFLVPRKAFFLGRWIRHCGWYPGHVLRVFRKDRARITDRRVHEGVRVAGSVGRLRNPLLHYTYPTVESYFARFHAYTTLAAEELREIGARTSVADLVFRPVFQFMKMYVVKLGFLDGIEGFALCAFSSFYVLVKYLKLRDMARGRTVKR
jgi:glycosyltransferase involved in cell wall biosynthesis